MGVELVVKLISILALRVAEAIANGHATVPIEDLFMTRTAEDALNELEAKKRG